MFNYPNHMIWVQGEEAAKAYSLAPNTTLPLWDAEKTAIYLKSTDMYGKPSMKILDYTIREEPKEEATGNYATKEDINKLEGLITALMSRKGNHEPTISADATEQSDADDTADKEQPVSVLT